VLLLAVFAGVAGNVAQRKIYGPTERERAANARIEAARAAQDLAAFERAKKEAAVDIGPREFAWTVVPPLVIGGIGVLWLRRRWPAAVPVA
jgi:hypothetical protein